MVVNPIWRYYLGLFVLLPRYILLYRSYLPHYSHTHCPLPIVRDVPHVNWPRHSGGPPRYPALPHQFRPVPLRPMPTFGLSPYVPVPHPHTFAPVPTPTPTPCFGRPDPCRSPDPHHYTPPRAPPHQPPQALVHPTIYPHACMPHPLLHPGSDMPTPHTPHALLTHPGCSPAFTHHTRPHPPTHISCSWFPGRIPGRTHVHGPLYRWISPTTYKQSPPQFIPNPSSHIDTDMCPHRPHIPRPHGHIAPPTQHVLPGPQHLSPPHTPHTFTPPGDWFVHPWTHRLVLYRLHVYT